ncbi:hypothetical protein MKW94_003369 [Papaver nudicaule]|uniref:Pentatricopeptide repeat-containing protein n=1 Tax=Papaver nudicaule TaxID=74823 RepID=A0AA41UY10_PAPNU|nr:hypothetical protein [Papaver nudicaule]
MLSKWAKARACLSPIFTIRFISSSSYSYSSSSASIHPIPIAKPLLPHEALNDVSSKELALSIKDWFKSRNDVLLDRIYEILVEKDDDNVSRRRDTELNRLGFRLNEELVLKVLNHCIDKKKGTGTQEIYACLKFFDWAGRQPGFSHTRVTFNAIFKILTKEKLMNVMLSFLDKFKNQRHGHNVRFYDTLVMGYAIAGKPEIALQLFGKMRFQGLDLDSFAYHVFLNALVEQGIFDVVDVIFKQITMRGLDNEVTSSLRVKSFVKQNKLKEAEAFLRGLESSGGTVNDSMLGILVDALCKANKFDEAGKLLKDFWELKNVPMPAAYDKWIRNLVRAGNINEAMEFLRDKQFLEGYLPVAFRYNVLIGRLLRENRLMDVYDLLLEMREGKVTPDKGTMNSVLCFFCKAGMVDVAFDLYNSRLEYGLSLSSMAYNYLINTLCGDGSVDDAYAVLSDSIDQGYFPGKKTFAILARALIRVNRLDKMINVIKFALEHNVPCDDIFCEVIFALCVAGRADDAYRMHAELSKTGKVTDRNAFLEMIRAFSTSNRGNMASKLLIEMQENGYTPTRYLYRSVIGSICRGENPENHFLALLEMQLSRQQPEPDIYNFFIDGAGHAKAPGLARRVFDTMLANGVEPLLSTKILMLQSYLKGGRIDDALNFFDYMHNAGKLGNRVYNTLLVGLCKAQQANKAHECSRWLRSRGFLPTLQYYEELVNSYCLVKDYRMVVKVIQEMEQDGRQASTFIGNVLLYHAYWGQFGALYDSFVNFEATPKEASLSSKLTLGHLVGLFSGRFNKVCQDQFLENMDEVVSQCFPPDLFTYNMLLRRLTMSNKMDNASQLFHKMCMKGFEPNMWTYDIIIRALWRHGKIEDAKALMYKMERKGCAFTYRVGLIRRQM